MKIEDIVKEKSISHMDAVLWYCEQEGLELEGISPLISKALKEKIEANARELNFLPRQAKLPIKVLTYIMCCSNIRLCSTVRTDDSNPCNGDFKWK